MRKEQKRIKLSTIFKWVGSSLLGVYVLWTLKDVFVGNIDPMGAFVEMAKFAMAISLFFLFYLFVRGRMPPR